MFYDTDEKDEKLIHSAQDVLNKNFHPVKHTVGAAVLCSSGKIYTGINIYGACGYGPCAEPIAIGSAISSGEREIISIVAVHQGEETYLVLSPCGNCRQLILDYAPKCLVIFSLDGRIAKAQACDLLPGAYESCFE